MDEDKTFLIIFTIVAIIGFSFFMYYDNPYFAIIGLINLLGAFAAIFKIMFLNKVIVNETLIPNYSYLNDDDIIDNSIEEKKEIRIEEEKNVIVPEKKFTRFEIMDI